MATASAKSSSAAIHKGELVTRWERKAGDLEKLADRQDARGDDGTDLRLISDVLRSCALELTQSKF